MIPFDVELLAKGTLRSTLERRANALHCLSRCRTQDRRHPVDFGVEFIVSNHRIDQPPVLGLFGGDAFTQHGHRPSPGDAGFLRETPGRSKIWNDAQLRTKGGHKECRVSGNGDIACQRQAQPPASSDPVDSGHRWHRTVLDRTHGGVEMIVHAIGDTRRTRIIAVVRVGSTHRVQIGARTEPTPVAG